MQIGLYDLYVIMDDHIVFFLTEKHFPHDPKYSPCIYGQLLNHLILMNLVIKLVSALYPILRRV